MKPYFNIFIVFILVAVLHDRFSVEGRHHHHHHHLAAHNHLYGEPCFTDSDTVLQVPFTIMFTKSPYYCFTLGDILLIYAKWFLLNVNI